MVVAQAAVKVDLGSHVNLEVTLECGQAFRWRKATLPDEAGPGISYLGVIPLVLGSNVRGGYGGDLRMAKQDVRQLTVIVGQTEKITDRLTVVYDPGAPALHGITTRETGVVEAAVLRYFSADDNLPAIEREIAGKDPAMAEAVPKNRGLRILRQDPWECLASYVLSINNSIRNISRIVEYFANCLGDPAGLGERGFPPPERIAAQDTGYLRRSRCGFRDRYLKDAADKVSSDEVDLSRIPDMPTGQARDILMKIRGVGPKVADCVLLFAYHRLDVFPVDVWIARAMSRYYLEGRTATPKSAREEGIRRFGALAGYAQEHLFRDIRT